MEPIKFKKCNLVYAANQPEYNPLPVLKYPNGRVVSCWKLSIFERLKVLIKGNIWLSILTFNKPLQPLLMTANQPFKDGRIDCYRKEECEYFKKWGRCYPGNCSDYLPAP